MKPILFTLKEHSYPGLNYEAFFQDKRSAVNALHTHDYYELFLVVRGPVKHFINDKTTHLERGTLLLIRATDVHQVILCSDEAECMNLSFNAELMDTLLKFWDKALLNEEILNSRFPPRRDLSDEDCEYVAHKILKTKFRESVSHAELLDTMKRNLFDIFSKFFAMSIDSSENEPPLWLKNTLSLMREKENFSAGFERMPEISGKSAAHLSRSMVRYCGIKPTQYINMLRTDYMASALLCSDKLIIDIWLDAGFQSASHANKIFRERYGVSPRAYRENF